LVSPPQNPPDPDRFSGVEGTPCHPIKKRVAEEPLDPLPLPDGISPHVPPELSAHDENTVVREVTRTATAGRRTEEITTAALVMACMLLLGAAVILGSVIYRFLF